MPLALEPAAELADEVALMLELVVVAALVALAETLLPAVGNMTPTPPSFPQKPS